MAEGDLYIALEPTGYYYPSEEGASFSISGHEFVSKGLKRYQDNFFIAPNSPWIGPRPKQFRDRWTADPDRVNHLQLHDQWNFNIAVAHRKEYLDQRLIGVSPDPQREWIYVRTPEADEITDADDSYPVKLNGTNNEALAFVMEKQGKVKIPHLYVVAATKDVIPGRKAPFIRSSITPQPHDTVVFGTGKLAYVLTRGNLHTLLLNYVTNQWDYLGSFAVGDNQGSFTVETGIGHHGDWGPSDWNVTLNWTDTKEISFTEFGSAKIGVDEIWVGSVGWGKLFKVDANTKKNGRKTSNSYRSEAVLGRNTGKWWVAMPADEEIYFQVERLAFDVAQHVSDDDMFVPYDLAAPRANPLMFNFGSGYKPTPEPQHFCDCVVHGHPNEEVFLEYAVGGTSIGGSWSNAEGEGEEVHYRLLDDKYLPWAANGRQYAGLVHLKLSPATDGESAPQVRSVNYQWGSVLTPRTRYLDDASFLMVGATDVLKPDQWSEFRISTSMLDPASKQFECIYQESMYNLVWTGTRFMSRMEPYEKRTGFPVEIWREKADGSMLTVGAAWVTKIEKQNPMILATTPNGTTAMQAAGNVAPVSRWRILGRGLAWRMRQPWAFTAAVDNFSTTDGRITHVGAVRQACYQTGFRNNSSTLRFTEEVNNYLPGDVRSQSGTAGSRERKSAFHPDWNQLKLDYVLMIALGWSGWNFYERINGLLIYEPDVLQQIHQLSNFPDLITTFYSDREDAIAAEKPNHVWLSDPGPEQMVLEIQANVVRVVGKGQDEGEFAQVIVKDYQSIRGPTTYDNFHGEPKVVVVKVDIAVNEEAAGRVAWMMLDRFKLRGEMLRWRTPIPAWDLRSPTNPEAFDVGDSCVVQHFGNYVVVHSEVDVLDAYDEQYTNFTGWRWPTGGHGGKAFGGPGP